jgi:hypothetical protein
MITASTINMIQILVFKKKIVFKEGPIILKKTKTSMIKNVLKDNKNTMIALSVKMNKVIIYKIKTMQ